MEFGRALMRINREFMRQANRMLEHQGLTASQAETLFFLHRREYLGKPSIQKDIEEALELSNPTVSGTVDRLEKKGLVRRAPSPENRRVNRIVLTPKARKMHEMAHQTKRELEERLLGALTDDERRELVRLLEKILTGVSDS